MSKTNSRNTEITKRQKKVLQAIQSGANSVMDIAYQINATNQEVIYDLTQLRKKNLVEREERTGLVDHGRKYNHYSLTQDARTLVNERTGSKM